MIIRGILDRSLSNQICVRGFARIKELARVSSANPEYQRELIDKQIKLTSNFLVTERHLFFPEVILSLKLKQDLTIAGAKKDATPIQLIESNKSFRSNVNSLSIKPIVRKNNKVFDVSEKDTITIVEINFDDGELLEMIEENNHPFHRIDGNHRLSAAEQIEGDDRVSTMNIPFCVMLFEEITSREFSAELGDFRRITTSDFEQKERVTFYNINSKSIPLTLEENLKGILGEDKYFSNEEIDEIFEDNGSIARLLGNKIDYENFTSLTQVIKDNKWGMCLKVLQLYDDAAERGDEIKYYKTADYHSKMVEDLYEALQEINILYRNSKPLSNHPSVEVLIAFLYYKAFSTPVKYEYFTKWIIKNHLFEAQETTAESIIKIFDSIFQKKYLSVFVAMPYWSHQLVNEYNRLFKEILKDVQTQSGLNIDLELIPIMRFTGKSERIDKRLLESIRKCDIFVADLTGCNPNVLYEVAFAEGCNKISVLIKDENDEESILPFDMDKRQYIPYDDSIYYNDIKAKVTRQLKTILKEDFKMYH